MACFEAHGLALSRGNCLEPVNEFASRRVGHAPWVSSKGSGRPAFSAAIRSAPMDLPAAVALRLQPLVVGIEKGERALALKPIGAIEEVLCRPGGRGNQWRRYGEGRCKENDFTHEESHSGT